MLNFVVTWRCEHRELCARLVGDEQPSNPLPVAVQHSFCNELDLNVEPCAAS
jgi:hypothetical protein